MAGYSIAEKIIMKHSELANLKRGEKIDLKIDQTLTQDATGTMAYLQLEALGIKRVKTELSVAYIDHNMLQNGFMNADDHEYIESVAKKFGIYYSRPGNGICHQVHLERFAKPGKTLIGSDSHTPTCGGIGMLAFGAGGLDVACAMAGYRYSITMPKIIKVNLIGMLRPWVSAKDIILKVLQLLGVKGGVGKLIEYGGDGVFSLTVPERATITNMGAELGLTSSIFPSDEMTRKFLIAQDREEDWVEIFADEDAQYDEIIDINLNSLEPLVACPNSPDNVKSVSELSGLKISQVCIGSCTNSSLTDMMKVAYILRGKTVKQGVSLSVSPGSRQVLAMLTRNGMLADIIDAGARILECSCGPCIGMGQSPKSKGVSLRTFNRNFLGRSGTKDGQIFLASPEVAAQSAIDGFISSPFNSLEPLQFGLPEKFIINDNMIEFPLSEAESEAIEIKKGPNIKPFPLGKEFQNSFSGRVGLKVSDNITTDHIIPAGSKVLPYRSNIPYISQFCFEVIDPSFPERAKLIENGIIIAGSNYGQGSSREHAALVPLYLGVRAIIAKSFARIHRANLVNSGILPLVFSNEEDYNLIDMDDLLLISNLEVSLESGSDVLVLDETKNFSFKVCCELNSSEKQIVLAGGLLNFLRKNAKV